MRVTHRLMSMNMLNNLNNNYKRLLDASEQVTTGKRIRRPSDDPGGAARSLRIRSELNEIEQYRKNINTAMSILEYSDDLLNSVGQGLHRAHDIADQALNDTYDASQRQMMAMEIDGILNDLYANANSTYSNRHIFGGTYTEQPFEAEYDPDNPERISNINFAGNSDPRPFEMGVGQTMDTSMDGAGIFDPVFEGLIKLRDGLLNDDRTQMEEGAQLVDAAFDNLLLERAVLGAKVNQLELTSERMASAEHNLKKLQLEVEDVDQYEAIINLNNIEALHHLSLNVTAKIIQPTLMDYLR